MIYIAASAQNQHRRSLLSIITFNRAILAMHMVKQI